MTSNKAMRLDQSVTRYEQDRYGFRHVATQLAKSIRAIGREGALSLVLKVYGDRGKPAFWNPLRSTG